jgi:hypothetical protein
VLALDKTLNVPVSEPTATGLKETKAVQLAAGARVAAQLFNCAKDVGLVPASVMLFMVNVAAVLFVIVTEWACVVVPTSAAPNATLTGEIVSSVVCIAGPERVTF